MYTLHRHSVAEYNRIFVTHTDSILYVPKSEQQQFSERSMTFNSAPQMLERNDSNNRKWGKSIFGFDFVS